MYLRIPAFFKGANIMKLIDCHNHSTYSFDGKNTVEDMVKSAQQKGVYAFAITDHFDVNYDDDKLEDNIQTSVCEMNQLKDKYIDMKLIAGFELGQALQDKARAERLLSIKGLDFVIGSIHNVKDEEDFYFYDYSKVSDDEIMCLLEKYYNELHNMAKWGKYDTMAHIAYPYRYMTLERAGRQVSLDIGKFDDIVTQTFKVLIQNGKAIELNTSNSFMISQNERDMITKYLKMYHELGGEYVTVGSDAHNINDIGRGLNQAYDILSNIGFQYVTYFENRKPVMVKI